LNKVKNENPAQCLLCFCQVEVGYLQWRHL